MQKLTHFTVSKTWDNKIPVGRLGGVAPQLFGRGGHRLCIIVNAVSTAKTT